MNKLKQIIGLLILTGLFSTNAIQAQTNQDREIESIANQLVQKISGSAVKNVAIADFANLDGSYSELGKYLAEEFSFALTSIDKNFNIIDRSKVNYLLKEAGLASDGLVDPNTIAKLGNVKGIDAIVSGSLTPQGNNMRVFIKVLDLETANILAAVRGDISSNPDIIAMSERSVSNEAKANIPKNNKVQKSDESLEERREFKQKKETHTFEFGVTAGQYIEVKAKPVGNDLNLRLAVLNPAGNLVYEEKVWWNQRGSNNINYKSGLFGANGKYKIQILNWYKSPASGAAVGAGIGVYDVIITAKNKEEE